MNTFQAYRNGRSQHAVFSRTLLSLQRSRLQHSQPLTSDTLSKLTFQMPPSSFMQLAQKHLLWHPPRPKSGDKTCMKQLPKAGFGSPEFPPGAHGRLSQGCGCQHAMCSMLNEIYICVLCFTLLLFGGRNLRQVLTMQSPGWSKTCCQFSRCSLLSALVAHLLKISTVRFSWILQLPPLDHLDKKKKRSSRESQYFR